MSLDSKLSHRQNLKSIQKVSSADSQPSFSLSVKSDSATEEKVLIWVVYSLWYDKGEWHIGDMFYQVDRITRKKTRIVDAVEKDLVECGKA